MANEGCNTGCSIPVQCEIFFLTECAGTEHKIPCAVGGSDDWTMMDGTPKKSSIGMKGCDDVTTYGKGSTYDEKKYTYLMCIDVPEQVAFQEAVEELKAGDKFIIKRMCTMPDGTEITKFRPYVNGGVSESFQGDDNAQVFGFDWNFTALAKGTDECPEC